jgi:hypothetical protein
VPQDEHLALVLGKLLEGVAQVPPPLVADVALTAELRSSLLSARTYKPPWNARPAGIRRMSLAVPGGLCRKLLEQRRQGSLRLGVVLLVADLFEQVADLSLAAIPLIACSCMREGC